MNGDLRRRLLDMVEEEQRLHTELTATGEIFKGYAPRLADLNRRQALDLEAIIDRHGWPGRSMVGEDGAHAAWFTVQHAIGCPAAPAQAAYLEDKIAFFERRPQRYGTQCDWDENGQMSPWALDDPDTVDERRRSVGLGPLAETIERFRRQSSRDQCPADLEAYREEMLDWARSVGWL